MKLELGLNKLPKIPKKYKIPLMLLVTIFIVVAAYFLLLKPQFEEKDRLGAELSKQKQELARLTAIKNGMGKQRSDYLELQEKLKELIKQMPEQKDVPNLLRNVSTIGQETRLRIKFFEPKAVEMHEFYNELPFEIRYSGPFHTIGYFFDGIRRLDRIITVTNFAFESRPDALRGALEGVCLAKTYVYTKEPLPKEKGKQKKDEPAKK